MRLYHRTTRARAEAILGGGFNDATDTYMTGREWTGVWLSNTPLSFADGIPDTWVAILELDLPAETVAPFEWIDRKSASREFLVPARIVNAAGRPALTHDEP